MFVVVGRAEQMGLGTMTEDFCAGMKPDLCIIINCDNGRAIDIAPIKKHCAVSVIPIARWRYTTTVREQLCSAKIVVGFESFYNDSLPAVAHDVGAKTAMFPMWEWSNMSAYSSDLLFNLSDTDANFSKRGIRCEWPAMPLEKPCISCSWPPKIFVHLAGNAKHNRNGTRETLLAAKWLIGSGAKLLVYHSFPLDDFEIPSGVPVELLGNPERREAMFQKCDCLVFPRRLPGHSLPINEALGLLLPVVVLDLPDWHSLPHKVAAHPDGTFTHVRDRQNPPIAYKADPEELGAYLRAMVDGKVECSLGPQIPTWDEFRQQWSEWTK